MLIKAKCIGYTEELVDRYVNNHGYDKYDRVTSVAYGNSEKIVIYKPIFWFIMDGIEYNTQPNYQSSVKRFVEGDGYEIYIDPKNPNVCRIK